MPRLGAVSRDEYILRACRGMDVLHLGCSDAPYTKSKYRSGRLLHASLRDVANKLVGVDIDEESVEWLRVYGFEDVFVHDVMKIDELLKRIDFQPEVIVAGELLEHLAQPYDFLLGIRSIMQSDTLLIVSVPNAFSVRGFFNSLFGREKTHPDHMAYYSYVTINSLLEAAGFNIIELLPYRFPAESLKQRILNFFEAVFIFVSPLYAPGFVLKVRVKREACYGRKSAGEHAEW